MSENSLSPLLGTANLFGALEDSFVSADISSTIYKLYRIGKKAEKNFLPMQDGDIVSIYNKGIAV